MNFTSFTFIIFLVIGVAIYFVIPMKIRWVWLLVLSILFYVYATPKAIVYLLVTMATTYIAAKWMGKINSCSTNLSKSESKKNIRRKTVILILTIICNIAVLAFLKYLTFGSSLLKLLFQNSSVINEISKVKIWVPIGISFYTLQVIGYCLDVYNNKYKPENNLAKYALFVMYFPHILQGPIARYDRLTKTLYEGSSFDYYRVKSGFQLLLFGYFKKMVIADRAGIFVNHIYNNYQSYEGFPIFIASILYSFQLYMDFSGCVDIALGISEILGIQLDRNFKHPYFATSIKDFWRKWHISLSTWLKDYIYIPLGGSHKGVLRKYINILIVFLISGIWHGGGIHYIFWGLLHAIYQIVGGLLEPVKRKMINVLKINDSAFSYKLLKIFITFNLVNFAWIFFRAPSFTDAISIIRSMFNKFNPWILFDGSLYTFGLDSKNFWLLIICIIIVFIISLLQEQMKIREKLNEQNLVFRWGIYLLGIFSIIMFGVYGIGYDSAQFIYGQF